MAEKGERRDPSTHRTPTQMRRLARKNSAPKKRAYRRELEKKNRDLQKAGKGRVGDGLDVAHKKPAHKGGTLKDGYKLQRASKNRAWRAKPRKR